MTESRHETVHRIFTEAIRRAPGERSAFLDRTCAGDAALRAEIDAMLAEDARDDSPLEALAAKGGARFLADALARDGDVEAHAAPMPERVGKYRILRRIGEGGMGVVYEAEQDDPRRRVALKVIRTSMITRDLLRRFRHEARVLGRLRHPGIAHIYEAGTADTGAGGQPYFAMEFVEGTTITDHVEAQGLDAAARLELLAQLCDILEYAHQKGVIHRDIKPANILVTPEVSGSGTAAHRQPLLKVLDFGVARATDADLNTVTLQTTMGQLVGTVPYMSPEQASGDPAEIDTRSDVYSVGVLGWELLTGRLPYDVRGRMVHEAVRVIREEEASRLSAVDRSLRGDVDTIFAKALEKEKDRRYQSAADIASDIRRHLAHEPIAARPASTAYQLRKFARRNKTLVGGAAATLVVALAGAWVATGLAITATQRAQELEYTTYIAGITAACAAVEQADYATAARILDDTPDAHRGWEYAHLRARTVQHVDEWPTPQEVLRTSGLDPTGTRMIAVLGDNSVATWDVDRGTLLGTVATDGINACTSASSGRVAYTVVGEGILVEDADGSVIARLSGHRGDHLQAWAWDDPGRRLIYAANGTRLWDGGPSRLIAPKMFTNAAFAHRDSRVVLTFQTTLRSYDVATGERLVERSLDDSVVDIAFAPDDSLLAVAGLYRNVILLDPDSLEEFARLQGHQERVRSVAWTADGARLISSSDDGTVRIWDAMMNWESTVIATGVKGEAVLTADQLGYVVLGDRVRRFAFDDPNVLRGHESYVYRLAFSPDGSLLASVGYYEDQFRVWDVASRRIRWSLPAPQASYLEGHAAMLRFSDDGRRVVAFSEAGMTHHDVETGVPLPVSTNPDLTERLHETLGSSRDVRRDFRTISPDGGVLVHDPTDDSGIVRIFAPGADVWTATPRAALKGHVGTVYCATFSPDGTRIATGGNDATVRVWDAKTAEQLLVLRGHKQYVMDVIFSPDGTLLASASGDQTVRLWETIPLHERRAMARE